MGYQIESRNPPEQPTAVVRGHVTLDRIGEWMGAAYGEVYGYLGRARAAPCGPPFGRFTVVGDGVDVEAGVPISARVDPYGRVEPSTLPGGPHAAVLHVGPYDSVGPAYEAVDSWIRAHGYVPAGMAWENYLSDPATDPEQIRTEVVEPYHPA